MVSSIGSDMSGMTLNDREVTQAKANKFSSHQDWENSFDDREITGKGMYDYNMGE
jgi:hypothetical protein